MFNLKRKVHAKCLSLYIYIPTIYTVPVVQACNEYQERERERERGDVEWEKYKRVSIMVGHITHFSLKCGVSHAHKFTVLTE